MNEENDNSSRDMVTKVEASSLDEKALVRQAKAGDYQAFMTLVDAHKAKVYALARRLAPSVEDAEDIVQETLLKAIDKIDQFRLEASFGTWLYTIALNQARAMFAKSRQAELRPIEEYLPSKRGGGETAETRRLYDWRDPARLMEENELRDLMEKFIGELPYKYREAFVLRYIEDLPVKEVAQAINESEAATKSRILRARLALREQLSQVFEEDHDISGQT